jgi:uncharacterized protein DUF1579
MKKAVMCVAFIMCVLAAAQEKPKGTEAAKPPEEKTSSGAGQMGMARPMMEKLSKMLVGTWAIIETHEPNPRAPKGASGKGTATFKKGPGGLSLIQDYKSKGTKWSFAAHGVSWWDDKAGGYKGIWCDSMIPSGCVASNGVSKWEGDNLVGTDENEMMGQKMAMKVSYSLITPNSFTFAMDGGPPGGEMKRMITIKYTRIGAAKAETPKP